jgi:hypothetical protein
MFFFKRRNELKIKKLYIVNIGKEQEKIMKLKLRERNGD